MPIADAKKRRIGRELIDFIYLGIRSGARLSVADYQRLKVSAPALAEASLLRAVHMPLRARARINEASRVFELENGAGTFNAFLVSCLALAGTVTLAELNTELTTLETYANNLRARKLGGESLDSIAADIQTNVRNEVLDWTFGFFNDVYVEAW
jgi:hypothetical protein